MSLIEPLRSRASFAALSSHGRRRQGRWCWVRYAPFPTESSNTDLEAIGSALQPSSNVPQIGYAIGKKVGNAVVRNRIRRRLRPIIVAEAHHLPPGIYLIGVKNDQAARISHDELDDDLRTTLAAASRAPR
ncbi:MAG: ribonuclease P protein component [Acidimicrobiales bacterium]